MTVTSGFVELHFVSVRAACVRARAFCAFRTTRARAPQAVFNAAALLLLCRLVEPRWGSAELLRFAAATAAGAGLATFLLLFLAYVASRNEYILCAPRARRDTRYAVQRARAAHRSASRTPDAALLPRAATGRWRAARRWWRGCWWR